MANILVTSAGQRVSLIRAFKNELTKKYSEGKVYTVDLNPALSPACIISDGYEQVKKVTDQNYISDLLLLCKKWHISLIIPTIDTELAVLSENKALFASSNIEVIVSSIKFVSACRDKRIINDFFTSNAIDIPKIIDKNNPTFPLFIKPYDGSLSKDIYLINDRSELTDYHLSNEKLMFMEYINPKEYSEFTIDAYYDKHHILKCAVPRKRIAVRSGEISKGLTCKNHIIPFLQERLSYIEGAIGCLTIQVFYNDQNNHIVGIEINPRFGGGYPLSYLAGANFPLWLIKEYLLKENIDWHNDWEDHLLMLRYDDEVLVRNYEE